MEIIEAFEETIANYCGSRYGIAVSSCTNAIFLTLLCLKHYKKIKEGETITIPNNTYVSVPMAIINAGLKVKFEYREWSGSYQLIGTDVYDSAGRFMKKMHRQKRIECLSFQYRKHIPIGRGGMILTDNHKIIEWLKQARHNGKHQGVSQMNDNYEMIGWDMYMTPHQALLGLTLFKRLHNFNQDYFSWKDYPDLSKQEIFK